MMDVHTERMCEHCGHPEICHDTIGTFAGGECCLDVAEAGTPIPRQCPCPGFAPGASQSPVTRTTHHG